MARTSASVSTLAPSISFSELDAFRQCPHKWYLEYRDRWASPEDKRALDIGRLFHEVLATHHRAVQVASKANRKSIRKLILPLIRDEHGEQTEIQELVEWMYEGYVEYRGFDREWEILAVEQRVNHKLPKVKGLKLAPRRATGILDLVVRWNGGLWIVDHKTGKDIPREAIVELGDQMPWYVWILESLGKEIEGVIYNCARTYRYTSAKPQPLEERFVRYLLDFDTPQLLNVAHDAALTVRRIDATPSLYFAERNTGEHCTWRCPYTEPCLAARRGMDETEFLEAAGFVQQKG